MSESPRLKAWQTALSRPVDPFGLGLFRVLFCLFLAWEAVYFIRLDFVTVFVEAPEYRFGYDLLPFVQPLPGGLTAVLPWLMLGGALLAAAGLWFRPALLTATLSFAWLFFLERSIYNNHLYLMILLGLLLALTHADRTLSLRKGRKDAVPRWQYLILQLQMGIVYFYGGVAKLNADWLLHQEPPRTILAQSSFMVDWLGPDFALALVVYGGLVFDLLVFPALLWRRSRPYALGAAVLFNLLNSQIFNDINIFPFLMLSALLLFVEPDRLRKFFARWVPTWSKPLPLGKAEQAWPRGMMALLGLYFAWQILFPLRHHLIAGDADWSMEGQRFSWRMKNQHKRLVSMEFMVLDFGSKMRYPLGPNDFQMNDDQLRLMAIDPLAVQEFAAHIQQKSARQMRGRSEVHANVVVAFNGRPPAPLVQPEVDLAAQQPNPLGHDAWIMPLPSY